MATKDKDDKDDELVVVTDDPTNLDAEREEESDDDAPSKKKKAKEEAEDDDEEEEEEEATDDDERLGASEETEREDDNKKKKQSEGKTRRQKRREAENRLRTELKFLETRNEQLERNQQDMARRLDTNEGSALDGKIAQAKAVIKKAEGVIADATTNSKGDELIEATRIRDSLRDQLKDLELQKKDQDEKPDPRERQAPNPRVVENVRNWAKANTWYDFKRGDYDSRLAGAIDDSLVAEGFRPETPEYWKELTKRIAKALPHRAGKAAKNGRDETDEDEEDEDDEEEETERRIVKKKKGSGGKVKQAPGGGPKFRTGGAGRELKPNEVYLSRERVEALKEAGAWDDPILRKKYLKRYRDYDKEHGTN